METELTFKDVANDIFYSKYHKVYPDNILDLEKYIQDIRPNNEQAIKHKSALLHFLDVLKRGESGFIYGMVCDAWKQLLNCY